MQHGVVDHEVAQRDVGEAAHRQPREALHRLVFVEGRGQRLRDRLGPLEVGDALLRDCQLGAARGAFLGVGDGAGALRGRVAEHEDRADDGAVVAVAQRVDGPPHREQIATGGAEGVFLVVARAAGPHCVLEFALVGRSTLIERLVHAAPEQIGLVGAQHRQGRGVRAEDARIGVDGDDADRGRGDDVARRCVSRRERRVLVLYHRQGLLVPGLDPGFGDTL